MRARARACVCVCVVSFIVKRPVLPPCVVDGRSGNPLHYIIIILTASFIGQFRIISFNEFSLTGRLFKGVRRVGSVSPFGPAVDRT